MLKKSYELNLLISCIVFGVGVGVVAVRVAVAGVAEYIIYNCMPHDVG